MFISKTLETLFTVKTLDTLLTEGFSIGWVKTNPEKKPPGVAVVFDKEETPVKAFPIIKFPGLARVGETAGGARTMTPVVMAPGVETDKQIVETPARDIGVPNITVPGVEIVEQMVEAPVSTTFLPANNTPGVDEVSDLVETPVKAIFLFVTTVPAVEIVVDTVEAPVKI